MSALEKFIGVLAVPIFFLNLFAGIVGGIWLLFSGNWELVIGGVVVGLVLYWFFPFLIMILLPLIFLAKYFYEKGKTGLASVPAFLNLFITQLLALGWVVYIANFALTEPNVPLFAILLFGYSVATNPFRNMASGEDPDAYGTYTTLFLISLGYILIVLFGIIGIGITILLMIVTDIVLLKAARETMLQEIRFQEKLEELDT